MYEKPLTKKCTFILAEKLVGNVEYQYTSMWNRFDNNNKLFNFKSFLILDLILKY